MQWTDYVPRHKRTLPYGVVDCRASKFQKASSATICCTSTCKEGACKNRCKYDHVLDAEHARQSWCDHRLCERMVPWAEAAWIFTCSHTSNVLGLHESQQVQITTNPLILSTAERKQARPGEMILTHFIGKNRHDERRGHKLTLQQSRANQVVVHDAHDIT